MEPVLEAILYTAGESGVTLGELASILEISESAMRQQLEAYQQRLAADDQRGLQVQQFADRYYLLTKPAFVSAIKKYFAGHPLPVYPRQHWRCWPLLRISNRLPG